MSNNGIWLKFFNCEEMCAKNTANKLDFFIDKDFNMKYVNSEEVLSKDTIFSARRFGPQKNEPDEIQEYKYSCNCGAVRGSANIGDECPQCHSKVKEREFPLSIIGWISLPFPILTPIGANFVANAIGTNRTRRTVSQRDKETGEINKVKKVEASKWTKFLNGTAPFADDDLIHLYDRFDEIMAPHIKPSLKPFFSEYKKLMFTTKFPVISRRLRRFIITKNGDVDQVKSDDLSKLYLTIINGANLANTIDTKQFKHLVMKELTKTSMSIFEYLCNELIGTEDSNSKTKIIKGEIYSTKNPYSARLLIEPDNHLKTGRGDTCRISYDSFRTLHRIDIMEIIQKEYKHSYIEADRLTDIDYVLNDKQKALLDEILENHEFWISINRPPSIDFSAIISTQVMGLVDENILYVNPIICGLIRGDFDGDTLSCYLIPMKIQDRMSKVMNPRRHSIWWDRSINTGYSVLNDQVIDTVLILNRNNEVEFL